MTAATTPCDTAATPIPRFKTAPTGRHNKAQGQERSDATLGHQSQDTHSATSPERARQRGLRAVSCPALTGLIPLGKKSPLFHPGLRKLALGFVVSPRWGYKH